MNNVNNLEQLREINNLTKKDIAKILDVSDSVYSRWENDKDSIPTRRMYQIANYYEVNIDYILGLSQIRNYIISSDEINYKLVSNRVKEIRKDFNETLRAFAKRLNTTISTWSAYETGKVLILGSFLIEICNMGGYSADWILGKSKKNILINNQCH